MAVTRRAAGGAIGLSLATAISLSTATARAHGGFPRAHQIVVDPSDSDHLIVRSDHWGLFTTDDGGDTWRLVCSAAYGSSYTQRARLSMVLATDGTIFVAASFDGLVATRDDACQWSSVPELADQVVSDVSTPDAGETLYALQSTGSADGIDARVWRSGDQGATWSVLGNALPAGHAASSVAADATVPGRLYVTGRRTNAAASGSVLFRSDDDGATWAEFDLASGTGQLTPRIAHVDATRPDTLFVRLDAVEADQQDSIPDAVLFSVDAGATWSDAFVGSGDLPGFLLAADAATLYVAGYEDGIWRASVDEVLASGPTAFEQLQTGRSFGLALDDAGDLLVGLDEFAGASDRNFTLARSADDGATFLPALRLCDVTDSGCGDTTTVGPPCGEAYADFLTDYVDGRCDAELDGGAAAHDDVPHTHVEDHEEVPASEDDGSCGCRVGKSASTRTGGAWLSIALVGLLRHRRPLRTGRRRDQARAPRQ